MNVFGFNIGRAPQPVEPHPIYTAMSNARLKIGDGLGHLKEVLQHAEDEVNQAAQDLMTHQAAIQDAEARAATFRKLGMHIAQVGADIERALSPDAQTSVAEEIATVTDAVTQAQDAAQDVQNVVQFPEGHTNG